MRARARVAALALTHTVSPFQLILISAEDAAEVVIINSGILHDIAFSSYNNIDLAVRVC